jgi:hypothetical protein
MMERSDAQYDLIAETAIDIALNAGYMLAKGEISVADSRELVNTINTLARVFEQSDYIHDDYIGQVDVFAKKRLLENYGGSPDKQKGQEAKSNNEIYILYACDQWKSRDSMRLVSASTDRQTLYSAVLNELYESRMDFDGQTGSTAVARFREAYLSGYIDFGLLTYGHTDEVYNETYFIPGQSQQRHQLYQLLQMDDEEFARTFPVPSIEDERENYEDTRQMLDEKIKEINAKIEPFYISRYDNGDFWLILPFTFLEGEYKNYRQEAFNKYAEANGEPVEADGLFTHGNGYEWEYIFKIAFKGVDGIENIDFDCEAGGFYAYSSDLSLMQRLAVEFKELCDDEPRFNELVSRALAEKDKEEAWTYEEDDDELELD